MWVADGGGRILNSEGGRNEAGVFRKLARWVDYSGPVTFEGDSGITLMDHPTNPTFPTPFHVRDDGWMCPSITLEKPLQLKPGTKLQFLYRLWIHKGVPGHHTIEAMWQAFAGA